MFEVIDNALSQEDFKNIKNSILNTNFPWNLSTQITNNKEVLPTYASVYFTHVFWNGFTVEPASQMFAPLLNIMNCHSLIRIKANCYPSTPEIIRHNNHFDYPYPHKGAIFYLNTNDGLTILEDTVKVESIENRLLLFDPSKMHASTTCTNDKCRINVNFNFF